MKRLRATTYTVAPEAWVEHAWSVPLQDGVGRHGIWALPQRRKPQPWYSVQPPSVISTPFMFKPQSKNQTHNYRRGFTLIELLVVIAIIGILAALLTPVITRAMVSAKESAVRTEISGIVAAIKAYENDYGVLPVTKATLQSGQDVTLGLNNPPNLNAEVMTILNNIDDVNKSPAYGAKFNPNNARNYKKTRYLEPKQVSDPTKPGFCTVDNVLRDAWGNPYIISIDIDQDGRTRDAVYSTPEVSRNPAASDPKIGFNGLYDHENANVYQANAGIMVWSLGADRNMKKTDSGKVFVINDKANQGVNKDNILSWK